MWLQRLSDRLRIGLFNWDDEPAVIAIGAEDLGVDLTGKRIVDLWTGEDLNLQIGGSTIGLAPHTSRVIEIID